MDKNCLAVQDCQARPQAFQSAHILRFSLNNATVGAEITSAGREFHKLTTLLVKKLCITSSRDRNLKSLQW